MPSKQSILDRAAGLVGAERITDPSTVPNNARSRRLVGLYDAVYEEALSIWPWQCARGRHKLPAKDDAPAWGFKYQYAIPGNSITVAAAQTGGCAWEVEQRLLLTDYSGPLNVITIDKVKENFLHPLVAAYAAHRLGFASIMGVSESTTAQERLSKFVKDSFIEAAHAENAQGSSLDKLGSEWVTAMQTGYSPELRVAGALPPEAYWLTNSAPEE